MQFAGRAKDERGSHKKEVFFLQQSTLLEGEGTLGIVIWGDA